MAYSGISSNSDSGARQEIVAEIIPFYETLQRKCFMCTVIVFLEILLSKSLRQKFLILTSEYQHQKYQLHISKTFLCGHHMCFVVFSVSKQMNRKPFVYRRFLLKSTGYCCVRTSVIISVHTHFSPPFLVVSCHFFCHSPNLLTFINVFCLPQPLRHYYSESETACFQGWRWTSAF